MAESGMHRLRPHPMETVFDQNPLFKPLEPDELLIDPEESVLDESLFDSLRQEQGLLANGFRFFTRWFVSLPEKSHPGSLPAEVPAVEL